MIVEPGPAEVTVIVDAGPGTVIVEPGPAEVTVTVEAGPADVTVLSQLAQF